MPHFQTLLRLKLLTSNHRCLTEEAVWMLLKGPRDYKPTEAHFINLSSFLNPASCPLDELGFLLSSLKEK